MKKSEASQGESASELISKRIAELKDWRGKALARMRKLIKEADPEVVEEWKWMGTPIWSHDGIICTGESYKNHVKLTFAKGASLKDPARLFNSSLEGNVRRAIDIHEGEEVDESAFQTLVRQAVALNSSSKSKRSKKAKSRGIPDNRDGPAYDQFEPAHRLSGSRTEGAQLSAARPRGCPHRNYHEPRMSSSSHVYATCSVSIMIAIASCTLRRPLIMQITDATMKTAT